MHEECTSFQITSVARAGNYGLHIQCGNRVRPETSRFRRVLPDVWQAVTGVTPRLPPRMATPAL